MTEYKFMNKYNFWPVPILKEKLTAKQLCEKYNIKTNKEQNVYWTEIQPVDSNENTGQ